MVYLFLTFTFGGPFILILGWFVDIAVYIYNLYTVPQTDEMGEKDIHKISIETLKILEQTCQTCIMQLNERCKVLREAGRRNEIGEKDKEEICANEFFDLLKERMNVFYEMGCLLYKHNTDDKFIRNEFKMCYQLNPEKIKKLKEYIFIKRIVNWSRTEDGSKVQVKLLLDMINNCFTKFKMQLMKFACHEVSLPKGGEQEKLLDDILEEFTLINPNLYKKYIKAVSEESSN